MRRPNGKPDHRPPPTQPQKKKLQKIAKTQKALEVRLEEVESIVE